ncbi:MAG: hypothetical protein Q8Q28_00025, partial [Pseudomonadota bacterium]|nr:hypothetical protein [Pseudomonadota bacterium]
MKMSKPTNKKNDKKAPIIVKFSAQSLHMSFCHGYAKKIINAGLTQAGIIPLSVLALLQLTHANCSSSLQWLIIFPKQTQFCEMGALETGLSSN